MSKSEYLQKYLSTEDTKSKKLKKSDITKKKKIVKNHKGLTIIDEDIDLKALSVKNTLDLYIETDDKPVLVNIDGEEKDSAEEENKTSRFTVNNWSKPEDSFQKRQDSDSDNDEFDSKRNHDTSSPDFSPPRHGNYDSDISPPRQKNNNNYDSDHSPPRKTNKAVEDNQISGKKRKVEVVFRDKTGKKRDEEKEKQEKESKEAKQKEREDKYKQWSAGLKQKEIKNVQMTDVLHEINKPMARYVDDQDLNEKLKDIERVGDPMLEYMQKKKSKDKASDRPVYKGPDPLPNRFNIKPGYRWDGVDRSNGFEKQYFLKQNERKVMKDIAYKWSTEDM